MTRFLRLRRDGERGFTLAEMLLAMLIFSVLGAVLFSTLVASTRSVNTTRRTTALTEEARIALNRMARELREAQAITAVSAPNPSYSLTFEVDFNGNGTIEPTAVDAEVLTYSYDGDAKQIRLTAATPSGGTTTLPILASDVYDFAVDYRSREYAYDANGDGITTWQELDRPPASGGVGDGSGTLTTPELQRVDSVVISFRVFQGRESQYYRTQVDLRNRA